jgi:hypothetical protein
MLRFLKLAATCAVGALAAPIMAEEIKGQAAIAGVPTLIELRLDNELVTLRHRPADNSAAWSRYIVHGPAEALSLLADQRLEFLWPALERWGGDDLSTLRNQTLDRTRRGWQEGRPTAPTDAVAEIGMSSRGRAMAQYINALSDAGQWSTALDLLTSERKRARGNSLRDQLEISWIISHTAMVLERMAEPERELQTWREGIELFAGSVLSVNPRLSLAARLAETGRYADSLELSEVARAAFLAGDRSNRVPNALPQFDWIRACALKGLGRAKEADVLMAGVADAEQVEMRRVRLPRVRDHEQRAYQCLRDPQGLADTWSRDLAQGPAIGSGTFRLAQLAADAEVVHRPTVDAAHAKFTPVPPLRPLPARYTAALRAWR